MICRRCGEENPDSYRYCGMCGDILQGPKAAGGADSPAEPVRTGAHAARAESMAFSRAESRGAKSGVAATSEPVEPIAGPSLLGLNQPSADSAREKAFSGMELFYPEKRSPAWGRILLTLLVLAGLCAVGWWRYKSYVRLGEWKKEALQAINRAGEGVSKTSPADVGTKPASENKSPASAETAAPANQPSETAIPAEESAGSAKTPPETAPKTSPETTAAAAKPEKTTIAPEKPAKPVKSLAAQKKNAARATTAKTMPAAADADASALFRKGEAYLYGRGVRENCGQAIRYLKSAAEKSSAQARSTFGTMYATGHCVPRDLPTSYRWFAMALQADPNNSVLEKDLSAVWNQMTPPERQLATRLKPQ